MLRLRIRAQMLIMVALLMSGCPAPVPPRRSPSPALTESAPTDRNEIILEEDPRTGFFLEAMRVALFVKPGTFLTADDTETLEHIWSGYELPGRAPHVDFSTYRVALLFDFDECHGGNGFAELRRLFIGADGRVRPEFARDREIACAEARQTLVPTVAYVVALRRDRSPRVADLRLGPARVVTRRPPRKDAIGECAPPAGPPPRGTDATLRAPAPGSVSVQYLSDGSPVFVVRHEDGSLDVFASDAPSAYDMNRSQSIPVRGLREQLRWYCAERRFHASAATYDEYGVPTMGDVTSLGRYRSTMVGDDHVRVEPERRIPGYGPRRARPSTLLISGERMVAYDRFSSTDLLAALSRPLGARVVVDADLVVGGHSLPRLCERTNPPCRGASAPARGLSWGLTTEHAFPGPFAARVSDNGFSDITSIQPTDDPEWLHYRTRFDTPHLEGFGSALGAVGSQGAAAGAEAGLDAQISWSRAHNMGVVLVGAGTGVGFRARWLTRTDSGISELRLGIAPLLEHSNWDRVLVYPSPLGVALPEFGVATSQGRAFPYLAWSLPVVWHLESRLLRQHPFAVRDVMGFRVAPAALLSFRDGSADWLYALSVGATVW